MNNNPTNSNMNMALMMKLVVNYGRTFEAECPTHGTTNFTLDSCVVHYICTECFPEDSLNYQHFLASVVSPEYMMHNDGEKRVFNNLVESVTYLKDELFPEYVKKTGNEYPPGFVKAMEDTIEEYTVSREVALDFVEHPEKVEELRKENSNVVQLGDYL